MKKFCRPVRPSVPSGATGGGIGNRGGAATDVSRINRADSAITLSPEALKDYVEQVRRNGVAAMIREGSATDVSKVVSGAKSGFYRVEDGFSVRPWGPYLAIQLFPIATNEAKPSVYQGEASPAAISFTAARRQSISELSAAVAAGTHPVGSADWSGALDAHVDRKGISSTERDLLRSNQSALAGLSMVSPYIVDSITDLQSRRDRALRELSSVIARITHDPGTADWAGAIAYHAENKGITEQERSLLSAGDYGVLATMSPVNPYAALVGKAISDEDFLSILGATVGGSSLLAEDSAARAAFAIPARGEDGDSSSLYRFPRKGSEAGLQQTTSVVPSLFKYDWTVHRNSHITLNPSLRKEDAFLLPDRELLIAPACRDDGPIPRRTISWSKEKVQVFLRTPSGEKVPGPKVDHYADLSLAKWWFEIAFALASDNRIISRLDSVNTYTGKFPEQDQSGPWNPIGWYAQVYYVRAIFEAIANAYNALNIPWYIDPVARALYRDWFAGHSDREYSQSEDYNSGNWFTNREQCGERRYTVLRARIPAGSWANSAVGEMPARLDRIWRELHDSTDTRTIEFLQKAGVMLWAGDASSDPYLASSASNRGFASGFAMGWDNVFASPLALSREPTSEERALYKGSTRRGADRIGVDHLLGWDLSNAKPTLPSQLFADDWYASVVHTPPLQDRNNICDWRSAGFDPAGVAGVHVQGSVPLRWYVQFAREWAMSCTTMDPISQDPAPEMPSVDPSRRWPGFGSGVMPRRSVGLILRDAKTFAMEVNMTWATLLGGNSNFAAALVRQSTEFNRSNPNAAVRTAGTLVSAIGGPILDSVVPGAGSLASAGVSMITDLLSSAFPTYSCEGYGRDDLGRPKPQFERSWLSGNVVRGDAPSVDVPIPGGFCRSFEAMPPDVPAIDRRNAGNSNGEEDEKTSSSTLGKIAIAGVVTVGVGALLASVIKKAPKTLD